MDDQAMLRFMYGGVLPPTQILPLLFVSDMSTASSRHMLAKADIQRVVVAAHAESAGMPFAEDGIEYLRVSVDDVEGDAEALLDAVDDTLAEFVLGGVAAAIPVLIHCEGGISRSISLTCALIMLATGSAFADALALVKHARPQANPNPGFVAALESFPSSPSYAALSAKWLGSLSVVDD